MRIPFPKGLMQDSSISSALAMEILQSCTKPQIWSSNANEIILKDVDKLTDIKPYMYHGPFTNMDWF